MYLTIYFFISYPYNYKNGDTILIKKLLKLYNMPVTKNKITYKRDKNKVEISGEAQDVKAPMWFDLICNKLLWLIPLIVLLFMAPRESFVPALLQWLKNKLPSLIFFAAPVGYAMLSLSG